MRKESSIEIIISIENKTKYRVRKVEKENGYLEGEEEHEYFSKIMRNTADTLNTINSVLFEDDIDFYDPNTILKFIN